MIKKQNLNNKIGEIDFRRKLSLQQTGGEKVLQDEFNQEGIEKILLERMEKTKEQIQLLKKEGILMSPYLELGAERSQRALVMENDFGFKGVAADISFDMLSSCVYYAKKFNKKEIPIRVCCDAYNLPFLSKSLPFVFCYETLHHFPDMSPIIKEIIRVLAPGGSFFFAEEPCKGFLQLRLFKSKNRIYSEESVKKGIIKRAIGHFLYRHACNETEHGIIENDRISIFSWRRALSFFEEKDVKLEATSSLFRTELFHIKSYLKFILFCLVGGGVSGICKKAGEIKNNFNGNMLFFRCPDCAKAQREEKLFKSDGADSYSCANCRRKFPIVDGILFLFSNEEFKKLYPKYYSS